MALQDTCDICGEEWPIGTIYYLDCYGGRTGLCENCVNADILALRQRIAELEQKINDLYAKR